MPGETRILFCHCASHGVGAKDLRQAALDRLRARGVPFVEVDDLCRLAADRDVSLAALAAPGDALTIIACHPRAVRWLLAAAGLPVEAGRLNVLDLRALTLPALLDQLDGPVVPAGAVPVPAADDWPPWFPVIDFSRCCHCRQCLSFCLFGVYALTPEGKVTVANPRGCKNNCPACARICPEVAIMFPKLPEAESPLNGDAIGDEQNLKARARIKAHEILGDDPYAALADRQRQARQRRLLKSAQERAEAERAACAGAVAPAAAATRASTPAENAP